MQYRQMGANLPDVSLLSLGSWHTFSRLSFDELLALLRYAVDRGINLYDVGSYADQPFNEVVFARAMQVLGIRRTDYVMVSKPVYGRYPAQSYAEQAKAVLLRTGSERLDIYLASEPPAEVDQVGAFEELASLVQAGLVGAWGTLSWKPDNILKAYRVLKEKGLPGPQLAQVQYNLARRFPVETPQFEQLLSETGIGLLASNVLEGGILAGHLARGTSGREHDSRKICRDLDGRRDNIREDYAVLRDTVAELRLTPAQAAIAFVAAHHAMVSTVVGVTKTVDLEANLRALEFRDIGQLRRKLASLELSER